jgi:uncharacterized protein YutE (UPF0331/DUF86 family)
MNRLNEEMVKTRAQEIRENLDKVRRYTSLPDADFWADERNLYTVMHLLLMSIEAIAALCSHILARLARRAPASYAECFEGLRELDVVDDELSGSLVQMARFRNLLVHRYWEIEPDQVLRYARENLGDFETFLASVSRLIVEGR